MKGSMKMGSEKKVTKRSRKGKTIAWLILSLMLFGVTLTGCDYSSAESPSELPIIGAPLGRLIASVTTFPANPSHDMLVFLYDTSYIEDVANSLQLRKGASFVDNASLLSSFWDIVGKAHDVVQPIGIALCTTFFIISIISMASKDNVTLEHYIRELVKFMIAVAIITNLVTILNLIMKASDQAVTQINDAVVTDLDAELTTSSDKFAWQLLFGKDENVMDGFTFESGVLKHYGCPLYEGDDFIGGVMSYTFNDHAEKDFTIIAKSCNLGAATLAQTDNPFKPTLSSWSAGSYEEWMTGDDWRHMAIKLMSICVCAMSEEDDSSAANGYYGMLGSMGNWFSVFVFVGVLALCALIAKFAAYFVIAQRLLEIGWRVVVAPISCANMFDGQGGSTPGVRSLKAFFAACLSGVVLIIILVIGTRFGNSIITEAAASYNSSLIIIAIAFRLATIGAAMGVSGKIREIVA